MRKITAIIILCFLHSLTLPAQETKEKSKNRKTSSTEEYTKFRFGGYGEMAASYKDYNFNRFTPNGSGKLNRGEISIPRFVLAFDYKFSSKWVLSTEIEFEYGGTGSAREIEWFEENGEYEIARGTDELKDQGNATKWIYEEMNDWITEQVKQGDEPFFAFYATPWPHAPVYVGDEFKGKSGMGTYVDCVTEFDYYLGKLFDTLEELGVMDNTIIVFTSDNGPALQGSTGDLRGGKYLAYEGGQKVPFMIRWGNNGGLFKAGSTYDESATLVDLFPTLVEMCGITGNGGTEKNYLPADRVIDGVSMVPVFTQNKVIHTAETPILHMKREKLKAIQYAIPTADILARDEYKDYDFDVLKNNEYVVFKYFKNIQNDNSAFFDKFRKNWLHILTDDAGENYNRTPAYPTIADEMRDRLDEKMNEFKNNRRGIIENS